MIELPKNQEQFNELSKYDKVVLLEKVEERLTQLPKEKRNLSNINTEEIEKMGVEVKAIQQFKNYIASEAAERSNLIKEAFEGRGVLIEAGDHSEQKGEKKNMQDIETRAFQKYLTQGYKTLSEEESRSLNAVGAAVVIPQEISSKLITDGKYSTLLARATVFNDHKAGKLSIPIASSNGASWKVENANESAVPTTYEATPTLTNIELGGFELYRWSRISAASYSLASSEFEQMLLNLLSEEVVEALEAAFIKGTGSDQPKGLDNLTWTLGTNAIAATTDIKVSDIASAISLLPAKHAKNAIVMCNTSTLADIAQFKGTAEYAYNLSDGAEKFLGHAIVLNEHVADDIVYIVNPSQLFVRFAMPLQVEANRSSGFTEASVDLRSLCVVDCAWNVKAAIKVSIAAG